jgi:RNA polymerase sigma-70 factor (ECF subfamily)
MDAIREAAHPGIPGMEAFACVSRAWAAHEAELRGFLRHGLGDEHAAEDLLQDTFIKAMREGQGFCSLGKVCITPGQACLSGGDDALRI